MKINIKNALKLEDAIKKAENPRTSARLLTIDDVLYEKNRIENRLSNILCKKNWIGLKFDIDPFAQSFPGSYRGTPESTQFRLERFPSGWFITAIYRGPCRGPENNISPINLDIKQKEIMTFLTASKNWGE